MKAGNLTQGQHLLSPTFGSAEPGATSVCGSGEAGVRGNGIRRTLGPLFFGPGSL